MSQHANRLLLTAAAALAALALGACGTSSGRVANTAGASPTYTQSSAPARRPLTLLRVRHTGRVINARASRYGPILADGANRTIYLFTRDRSAISSCDGACATAWPPVLTKGAPRPEGDLTAALATTRRHDGTVQVTYHRHPLYYYVGDAKPGQILCQNVDEFGGTWLVVSPHGTPVH